MQMEGNPDFTYTQGPAAIFSLWEANVGIWCNNLVRLKPFLREKLPQFHAMINSGSQTATQPTGFRSRTGMQGTSNSRHELSAMRKGGMSLGSDSELPLATRGNIKVTTDYHVDSHPGSRF